MGRTIPRMTPAPPIPLLRVAGTYAEVGAAIGVACRDTIARECDTAGWTLPAGRSVTEQLALADRYAAVTRPIRPWLFVELNGCAEADDVDPRPLWSCCI